MATLANVTRETRIILKLFAVSLIFIAVLFVFYKGGEIIKNTFFPTPPTPPEEKFGKLPPVEFPAQNPTSLKYRINTVSGRLPDFPDRITVYKTKKNQASLVALQAAREKARNVEFTENETKISEILYQWGNELGDQIQINILTNSFKISSNYLNSVLPTKIVGQVAKREGAIGFIKDFLQDMNIDITNINEEESTLTYLKAAGGKLVEAASEADAQFVRVDLFQNKIDQNFKIYYPSRKESIMYFIIRGDESFPRIAEAQFIYVVPDENNSSAYPIKTAAEAFEDLKLGNSLTINLDQNQTVVDIIDVRLGYYIGNEEQQYFLPIFIFEGKNFTAYVQAVSNKPHEQELQ